jgi:hypothetical protein
MKTFPGSIMYSLNIYLLLSSPAYILPFLAKNIPYFICSNPLMPVFFILNVVI